MNFYEETRTCLESVIRWSEIIVNIRHIALDLLLRIEKQGSFSHLLISNTLQKKKLTNVDEKLLTELVYGTLERKLTLDYYLEHFVQKRKKIEDWVWMLLRLSVFQIVYLEKVPEYAIINEAVEIAKKRGHKGVTSFVNGVLRNVVRNGVPDFSTIENPLKRLAIETSHPEWLIERWVTQFGFDVTEKMCKANLERKPVSIRVNRIRMTRDELIDKLQNQGISATFSKYTNDGIIIQDGNVLKTDYIDKGYATIQDQSSMLAVLSLQIEPNMKVLDTCSAPGGKATYIGELMNNTGEIYAYDLHQNKTKLIEKNAERLGLTNIKVGQHDARKLQSTHPEKSFDRILIDAPCSGLGVIRTKPDIKYEKELKDIEKLHEVQFSILEHVAPLLKDDGKLIYSTCTVEKLENDEVIKKFLNNNEHFEVDQTFLNEMKQIAIEDIAISEFGVQIFPHSINSDGFYISRIVRKG